MANTIKTTNRTVEISAIDSDYTMDQELNVESVVFIPGDLGDKIEIREFTGNITTSPAKTLLHSGDGEPRTQYFRQRLSLGFEFASGIFTAGAKIIFNIGER